MAQVVFKRGNLAKLGSITLDSNTLYFAEDQGVLFLGEKRFSDIVLATAEPTLSEVLPNRIHIFNNKLYFRGTKTEIVDDTPQTVEAVVCVDVGDFASEIASLKTLIGTIPDGATATTVVGYAKEVADAAEAAAKAVANEKVASVTAGDASIDVGTDAKNPELSVNLHTATGEEAANLISLKTDGLYVPTPAAADTYEIAAKADAGSYAAVYQLIKKTNGAGEGTAVGIDINIPKDFLVKSGSVVDVSESDAGTEGFPATAGTYIRMVVNAKDASATEELLWINVGSLIEYVTGAAAADGIITTAVDSNHVLTATINDGTITLAKLESDVQTAIGKAHEHANKALLDTYTQTEANLADAVAKKHEHANAAELDLIESGDKAKWDTAATKAGTAVQGVQVNGTDVAADGNNKVNITATTGEANGQIKIAGQAVSVYGLGSAAYQTSEYFVGNASSTSDTDTIKGAKLYADEAVETALTWTEF